MQWLEQIIAPRIFTPTRTLTRVASVRYRASVEAVFRAAPTDFGNWLDRFSDGRDFGPWRRRRHIDGELCLNFAFVVFGIEMHFGDR